LCFAPLSVRRLDNQSLDPARFENSERGKPVRLPIPLKFTHALGHQRLDDALTLPPVVIGWENFRNNRQALLDNFVALGPGIARPDNLHLNPLVFVKLLRFV
jgi:hypothetical protein